MKFGLDKCRTMAIKRGVQETIDEIIKVGEEELIIKFYEGKKEQKRMTEKDIIKQRLRKEFQSRATSATIT